MSQSNDELPKSQNQRIVFVAVVSVICAVLYLGDYGLTALTDGSTSTSVKEHVSIVKSVVENLIANAIAAAVIAFAIRRIIDWITPTDRVIEVPPGEITERLLKNSKDTRSYVFIGNTASFVSSSVLPILVESARRSGHPKVVTLFLIDPTDTAAVDAYVGYRARIAKAAYRVADIEQATWFLPQHKRGETPDEVVAKILATIYIAAHASQFPGMNISVYVRRSFTPFRADISDQEAVLTQESAEEAAVAFSARGHFYGWYQKEADAQKGQGVAFDFTAARDALRNLKLAYPTDPSAEVELSLRALLSHFPHLAPLATNSTVISKAAALIGRPSRPYR
jgi:hypothetical protein